MTQAEVIEGSNTENTTCSESWDDMVLQENINASVTIFRIGNTWHESTQFINWTNQQTPARHE
jgi:hypothetical protein